MNPLRIPLLIALLAPFATAQDGLPAPDDLVMLRLADGSIRWGSIDEHDPEGVRFRLLDHGGSVRVTWSLLDPGQEAELRQRYGYIDVSSEELTLDAERLVLVDGGEVVGVVVSREGDAYLVKTDGNLQPIPKVRVASITSGVRVPALDVYTREEIYAQELAHTPEDSAEAQLELARTCERILDFAHAVQHYELARELDTGSVSQEVEFALQRAVVKAEQQEQIDYLREVDVWRKRQQYDRALAMLAEFPTRYEGSPLMADALKKEEFVLKARDEAVRTLVQTRWHYWLQRLARDAAKTLTYDETVAYAGEELGEEIRERVLADVKRRMTENVQLEDIERFWESRRKVRYRVASFGLGTWILGRDGAVAGTEVDDKEEPEALSEADKERKKNEAAIKRFLENSERARKARSGNQEAEDVQVFWNSFPVDGRAQWIRATYVQDSGDVQLRDHPTLANCSSCAGRGVRDIILSTGGKDGRAGSEIKKCNVCRGVGVVRRVYYR